MSSSWIEYDLNILDELLLPLYPSLICAPVSVGGDVNHINQSKMENLKEMHCTISLMDIVIIVWQDRDRDDNLGDDQPSNDSHAADLTDTWQPTNKRASL